MNLCSVKKLHINPSYTNHKSGLWLDRLTSDSPYFEGTFKHLGVTNTGEVVVVSSGGGGGGGGGLPSDYVTGDGEYRDFDGAVRVAQIAINLSSYSNELVGLYETLPVNQIIRRLQGQIIELRKSLEPTEIHVNVGTPSFGDGTLLMQLEISATAGFTIDWGDGVSEDLSSGTHTHLYKSAGVKKILIYGILNRITQTGSASTYAGKLIKVKSWSNIHWTNMSDAFAFCNNLDELPSYPPNLSLCQWYLAAFRNTTNLVYAEFDRWDMSNATDISNMFRQSGMDVDISNWDVSNVNNMDQLFWNALSFNQDISNWCVANIPSEPTNFSTGSPLTNPNKPVWGTCP